MYRSHSSLTLHLFLLDPGFTDMPHPTGSLLTNSRSISSFSTVITSICGIVLLQITTHLLFLGGSGQIVISAEAILLSSPFGVSHSSSLSSSSFDGRDSSFGGPLPSRPVRIGLSTNSEETDMEEERKETEKQPQAPLERLRGSYQLDLSLSLSLASYSGD